MPDLAPRWFNCFAISFFWAKIVLMIAAYVWMFCFLAANVF